ncbi:MAG: hypothetical protein IPI49_08680 [Myxococcales bacterium]|nr:hypothetical protein [Myxococcales bacterium]
MRPGLAGGDGKVVSMASNSIMRVVGAIRRIELHLVGVKFVGVTPRQVAKIELDIERATNERDEDIAVENLDGMSFHGPPELLPRFAVGDRVTVVTAEGMQIASIRHSPVS